MQKEREVRRKKDEKEEHVRILQNKWKPPDALSLYCYYLS